MEKVSPISKQQGPQAKSAKALHTEKRSPFFKPVIQPRLAINQPGDIYEKEADTVADKVMKMEKPGQQYFFSAVSGISRKCDHCLEEEKQLQRKETTGEADVTPSTENYITSISGGTSLNRSERSFFEPRIGYDFSNVRIHTDKAANESAKSINALAYTHGNNIVFGADQYHPETGDGKKLLAHELTHVVQQSNSVQPRLIQKQGSTPGVCDSTNLGTLGPLFIKEESAVKQLKLPARQLVANVTAEDKDFVLFCPHKASVSLKRLVPGSTVYYIGSGKVKGKDEVWAQVEGDSNYYWGFIKNSYYQQAKKEEEKKEEETPKAPAKKGVCGPDVTIQVGNGVNDLRSAFKSKTPDEKNDLCQEVNDPVQGLVTWDFLRLHVRDWLKNFRPGCATVLKSPGEACCANSVEVNNECYYGGSVNYVEFGAICKLCYDHYHAIDYDHIAKDYTSDEMTALITKYKKDSGNYKQSVDWSLAGYDNWPSGGSPPKGDCSSDCSTDCPVEFSSFGTSDATSFRARWCPHIDPVSACKGRAANLWDYLKGAKQ